MVLNHQKASSRVSLEFKTRQPPATPRQQGAGHTFARQISAKLLIPAAKQLTWHSVTAPILPPEPGFLSLVREHTISSQIWISASSTKLFYSIPSFCWWAWEERKPDQGDQGYECDTANGNTKLPGPLNRTQVMDCSWPQ